MAQRNLIQLWIAEGVNENRPKHLWLVFMKLHFFKSVPFQAGQFSDILYKKAGERYFSFSS